MYRICTAVFAVVVVAGLPRAHAEPFEDGQIETVEPTGMTDRATMPARLSWCQGRWAGESWETGRIHRAAGSHCCEMWIDAADHLCEHQEDPTWRKQALYLIQEWMNEKNQSQADAERDIKAAIAQLKEERANAGKPKTDEQRFAFSSADYSVVKPEPGAPVAKISDRPAWCDKATITEKWEPGRIGRTVGSQYGTDGTIEGALHVCQRPTDATWKTEAGYILQKWMNWTHLPQADAEAALRARIQIQKFAADRDALCKALNVGPEVGGEAKAFANGQARFFGCGDHQPLWADRSSMEDDVGFYIDVAGQPDNEVLRMYWLFATVAAPWGHELPGTSASDNQPLLYYAVAQNDFAKLDRAGIDRALAAAPYNDYARTIAIESFGYLKAEQKIFEDAIDKLAKSDKDYQRILRDEPKKAYARWDTVTAQWKDEFARSNAFEKRLSTAAHSDLKGCSKDLQKDAEKLIRSYKDKTYAGLIAKIAGDPIATILLSRLAVCYAADGQVGGSGALEEIVSHSRELRGPRSLAHFAIIDALAEVKTNRPRSVLGLENFSFRGTHLTDLYKRELDFTGHVPANPDKDAINGVVKKVTKLADGLELTFQTQKLNFPEMYCVDDTSHPLKIESDGRIEYYRNCKATGKTLTQDETPMPVVIAEGLAAGVKPGAFVVVHNSNSRTKTSNKDIGTVLFVKKASKDTTILTFLGFTL